MSKVPSVLFVCVHNAGRSQMAAALLNHHAGGAVEVRSAGSAPADSINPAVREVMAEIGIDVSREQPKRLTTEAVEDADVVITMGCGDACPVFPGKRYLDWDLTDPAGKTTEQIRPIRDDIDARVRGSARRPRRRARAGQPAMSTPSVLFVCVRNGGKSQMAAGLMRKAAGDRVCVHSAGTNPGSTINALSAQVLAEVGADMSGETPRPIDPELLDTVDLVVTLGREAVVEVSPDVELRNWDTDEPSERGIDGIDRMRLIRDDIDARVQALLAELTPTPTTALNS